MSQWSEVAHFLYGQGFWYADPLQEIKGLKEDQLFWRPSADTYCILWHAGHIAHRERTHLGRFLQGLGGEIIPPAYDVFGTEWCDAEALRRAVGPVDDVLTWVRQVREKSHEYLGSLSDEDFHSVAPTSEGGLSAGQWIFITVAHTALHIGRIQLLRTLLEKSRERAC